MSALQILLIVSLTWLAVVVVGWWIGVRWLSSGPAGVPSHGLIWLAVRGYARIMQRVTVRGLEHVPSSNQTGGLVVVSNHTGPVDPVVIQAACRFEIRWMMAADMMVTLLEPLWRWQRAIPVARNGRDSGPAREAIRHVRAGGTVGIFPEGAIARPREQVRPFHEGVGLIIARTRTPVLLVWVSGTPESPEMFPALTTRGRARVTFVDYLEFTDRRDPAAITRELRQRLSDASGWPLNDEPLIPPERNPDPFAVAGVESRKSKVETSSAPPPPME